MNDKMLLKFNPPLSPRCKWPFKIFNINDYVDSKQSIHEVWHSLHSSINLVDILSQYQNVQY